MTWILGGLKVEKGITDNMKALPNIFLSIRTTYRLTICNMCLLKYCKTKMLIMFV